MRLLSLLRRRYSRERAPPCRSEDPGWQIRWAAGREPRRAHALSREHGVEELPPVAAPLDSFVDLGRNARSLTLFFSLQGSLEGSFSAGSTATIATKYSFFQVFRDLQNYLAKFSKILTIFAETLRTERCKGMQIL